MPRIEQNVLSSAFYLYGVDPRSGTVRGPGGSGCIIARASNGLEGFRHYYGVTNQHVIRKWSQICINTRQGQSRLIAFEPDQRTIQGSFDDLAAIDITDDLDLANDEVSAIPEELFSRQEDFISNITGLGDDIFMVGMFANEPGSRRNVPKVRFGNLSAIADEGILIQQGNSIRRPSHLVDMHSRTGFSGSAVFTYRLPFGFWFDGPWSLDVERPVPDPVCFRLLGIHSAQYAESIEVARAPSNAQSIGDPIREGDKLWVSSSMTVVVPAWRISVLLDKTDLRLQRDARDESLLQQREEKTTRGKSESDM